MLDKTNQALQILRSEGTTSLIQSVAGYLSSNDGEELEICCDSVETPRWVDIESPVVVRDTTALGQSYRTVSGNGDQEAINISFESPVDRVELDLTGTKYTIEACIQATNNSETLKKKYTSGDFRGNDNYPIGFSFSEPSQQITISITESTLTNEPSKNNAVVEPKLTLPSVRKKENNFPPIFLFSVDTLRYEFLDEFGNLLSEFNGDAYIPAEPRTVASATSPSHTSIFTSQYPGDHGYFLGLEHISRELPAMSRDLITIPKVLLQSGYKCSGIVSSTNVGADRGFADGFHRFSLHRRKWKNRDVDISTQLNTVNRWIDQDIQYSSSSIFYFAHFFDAHFPYVTPEQLYRTNNLDFEQLDELRTLWDYWSDNNGNFDYLKGVRSNKNPLQDSSVNFDIDDIIKYYRCGLNFVAQQLCDFIQGLRSRGIYDKSLIIITGDHGEEFFEKGFGGHRTLYDGNVRTGMIIKPPKTATWKPPIKTSTLDIFPTIAEAAGLTVPETVNGTAWQSEQQDYRTAYAERITELHYTLMVEDSGKKGIFTYKQSDPKSPSRPTETQIKRGADEAEFYNLTEVRRGGNSSSVSCEKQEVLINLASEFIKRRDSADQRSRNSINISAEMESQLERLGYK